MPAKVDPSRGADGKRQFITQFFTESKEQVQREAAFSVCAASSGLSGNVLSGIKAAVREATKPKKRIRADEPSPEQKMTNGKYCHDHGPKSTIAWWKEEEG
eukprot:gene1970-3937_t